jgi:phthiodiolone/phenolphthiodiolone dimycocerosates ketoreductase
MAGFEVGLGDVLLNTRLGPTPLTRANFHTASITRAHSFWVPDHVNALTPRSIMTERHVGPMAKMVPAIDAITEPWTMLGYLAAKNRRAKLRLGIGVTDAGRRNPVVTAQAAATLHLLTRGRAILGIGTGEREANEPYGVDWSKPVGRLIEALATIRTLWHSRGTPVSRESPYFPLQKAIFELPPYRGKWPEIWVAAHGPRMLRAAGRYGDAWFPASVVRPEDYARGLDAVRSAASDAGRDPMSITPAIYYFVIPGRNRDDADAALASAPTKAFALNFPADIWARHGTEHPFGSDFTGAQEILPYLLDEQTVLAAIREVPDSLMRECFRIGTAKEITEEIAEWRDRGLRHAVLCNMGAAQPKATRALSGNLEFARLIRQLRTL